MMRSPYSRKTEDEISRVIPEVPIKQWDAIFKAWAQRAKGYSASLLAAYKADNVDQFKAIIQKATDELDRLYAEFLVAFSQYFPKSVVKKKMFDWGERPSSVWGSLYDPQTQIDNIFVAAYVLSTYVWERMYNFVSSDYKLLPGVVKIGSLYTPDGKLTKTDKFSIAQAVKLHDATIDAILKQWTSMLRQATTVQKKFGSIERVDINGVTVELVHGGQRPNPKDIPTIRATLNALRIPIQLLQQKGFGRFFKSVTVKVFVDAIKLKSNYGGKSWSNTFAYYRDSTIFMPVLAAENRTLFYISAFIHEFAHHLHGLIKKKGKAEQEWMAVYKTLTQLTKTGQVASDYAYVNADELFAEVIAYLIYPQASHAPIPRELLDAVRYFFRTYLGVPFNEAKRTPYRSNRRL